jgi:hypothetical protein
MKIQRYVDVVFNRETGEVTVEAFNFTDKSCIDETLFIKEAIGYTTSTKLKPEYYGKKVGIKVAQKLCG